jgi:hypothetical protein
MSAMAILRQPAESFLDADDPGVALPWFALQGLANSE